MRRDSTVLSGVLVFLCGCAHQAAVTTHAASAFADSERLTALCDQLADNDVVFLGEEHDNRAGHRLHHRIIEQLYERRPNLVISMEMFERDVQEHVDRYLAGEIDEPEFLANSRPWKNYDSGYRPAIEFAKEHGLPVIAANIPRELASKVSKEGVEAIAGSEWVAHDSSAPKDRYWELFQQAMQEHGGVTDETMYRFYQSQCYKDDTMAEAIVDHLESAEGEPLVIHICGKFHSDARLGTVSRVAARDPSLRIAVVSMDSRVMYEVQTATAAGDFTLVVPDEPKFEASEKAAAEDETEENDPNARPGLGFMPGYDAAVVGVMVDMASEGGAADKAGIRGGDVIKSIDGEPIENLEHYMEILAELRVGQNIEVQIEREGEKLTKQVKVGVSHR